MDWFGAVRGLVFIQRANQTRVDVILSASHNQIKTFHFITSAWMR
jgi:hypothetical protein